MFQLQGVGGEVRLGAANTAMARQHSDSDTDKTNNLSLLSLDKPAMLFVCYPGLDSSGRENQNKTKDFDSFRTGDRTDKYLLIPRFVNSEDSAAHRPATVNIHGNNNVDHWLFHLPALRTSF